MNNQIIYGEALLGEAIEIVLEGKFRTCVVVDSDKHIIGVLSEGDIVRAFKSGRLLRTPVSDVMNPNPFTFNSRVSTEELIKTWREKGIECVPVVDQSGLLLDILNLRELI
jgi:CBS domain-containing protein